MSFFIIQLKSFRMPFSQEDMSAGLFLLACVRWHETSRIGYGRQAVLTVPENTSLPGHKMSLPQASSPLPAVTAAHLPVACRRVRSR